MKHGIKLRKLQRTSSHRWALLRNLVSALLHHEMIKTTLPKAREAARLAEKIISLGKKGTDPARRKAQSFLMPSHHYTPEASSSSPVPPPRPLGYPSSSSSSSSSSQLTFDPESANYQPPTSLLPKLFTTLATRYRERPGGYTRIHKYGRRPGDNAPHALVTLVDGPRDLKYEMAVRAAGLETARLHQEGKASKAMEEEEGQGTEGSLIRERTRRAREKVLKYRSDEEKALFDRRAAEYTDLLLAEGRVIGHRRPVENPTTYSFKPLSRTAPQQGRRVLAGERLAGMSVAHTGLGLARGDLSRRWGHKDRTPRFLGEKVQKDGDGAVA